MTPGEADISEQQRTAERIDPALLKLAGVVLAGAVTPLLDTTIVNVGIDTLSRQFSAPVSQVQWVSTGYLLALGTFMPVAGWAVDRFGVKRVWLSSLALFLLGSALSGMAWSVPSLIVFRVLQGIGGGLMSPLSQTIMARAAGPRRLGRAMSLVAIPAQLAPIVGPVLGGFLIGELGWRWMFFVNLPIGAAALLLAWRAMPDSPRSADHRLDVLGLALLGPGVAGALYAFSRAGQGGVGRADVIATLVAAVLLIGGFCVRALSGRTAVAPLLDVRLLKVRAVATSGALMFLSGIAVFGSMLLMPLYFQQVLGRGALGAGLLLAPQGLGTMVALVVVGRLTDRMAPRAIVLTGLAITLVGTVPFTQVGANAHPALLAAAMVLRGIGLGTSTIPVMAAAYRGLASAQIPRMTSMVQVLQRIGGSFGTALTAVILQIEVGAVADGGGAAGLAGAFGVAFWWTVGFTVLSVVPALFLPRTAGKRAPSSAEKPGGQDSSVPTTRE
ncbi:DHA2 family efflux MFS transporter permease subunit [Amycolatopsis sp. NPDC004079]|uniref:DHA2 family efflux MFS transporter permease subunit n=1 Tax=Amycolatopsis sp. NPDC004079 TaxID=3154549 RepID=UPI0033B6AC17